MTTPNSQPKDDTLWTCMGGRQVRLQDMDDLVLRCEYRRAIGIGRKMLTDHGLLRPGTPPEQEDQVRRHLRYTSLDRIYNEYRCRQENLT